MARFNQIGKIMFFTFYSKQWGVFVKNRKFWPTNDSECVCSLGVTLYFSTVSSKLWSYHGIIFVMISTQIFYGILSSNYADLRNSFDELALCKDLEQ